MFVECYDPTLEESYRKQVILDNQRCIIEIFKAIGQEEYIALREHYIKEGEGFLIVYSVTSRKSFEASITFYQQILRVRAGASSASALRAPIICLVANKVDRTGEREVSASEGSAMAKEMGCMFVESSARNRINVEEAFYGVVRLLREEKLPNGRREEQTIRNAIEEFQRKLTRSPHPRRKRSSILSLWSRLSASQPARLSLSAAQRTAVDHLLVQAARKDDQNRVKELLELGADPNSPSVLHGSALYASVSVGHEQMVRLLLKNGALVNAVGLGDQTCLHAASFEGRISLINLLINQKANKEAQSKKYGTPLLAAAAHGQAQAVQVMLERGANVYATGGVYGNAIQAAAWIGDVEIVKTLLDFGADPNVRGEGNCTALQVAAFAGKHEVVSLLLRRRVDLNDYNGKYGSPLSAASANSHFDVMKLLDDWGAKDDTSQTAHEGATAANGDAKREGSLQTDQKAVESTGLTSPMQCPQQLDPTSGTLRQTR